jgi:hypothetical protein
MLSLPKPEISAILAPFRPPAALPLEFAPYPIPAPRVGNPPKTAPARPIPESSQDQAA